MTRVAQYVGSTLVGIVIGAGGMAVGSDSLDRLLNYPAGSLAFEQYIAALEEHADARAAQTNALLEAAEALEAVGKATRPAALATCSCAEIDSLGRNVQTALTKSSALAFAVAAEADASRRTLSACNDVLHAAAVSPECAP